MQVTYRRSSLSEKAAAYRRWLWPAFYWNFVYLTRFNRRRKRQIRKNKEKYTPNRNALFGKYDKVLRIKINHSYAGLFAYVMFAINQLRYAEKYNYLPVADFGKQSGNGVNAYFEEAYGPNIWEYYFEPLAELSTEELSRLLEDPSSGLRAHDVHVIPGEHMSFLHMHAPDSVYGYPYGYYKYMTEFDAQWFNKQRQEARRIFKEYIRVKPHILEIVDDYVSSHFGKRPVLGIHMRGTDKGATSTHAHLGEIVVPSVYISYIDQYLEEHADALLFVATDQEQYLEELQTFYPGRVLSTNSSRSRDRLNIFQKDSGSPYKKGEEALVDCLLLSRCDFLLKCTSHLSETSLYFNPKLECIDTNYVAR